MNQMAGKAIMQDERTDAPQPQEARDPWVAPVLSRLSAGSAEIALGPVDDGSDYS